MPGDRWQQMANVRLFYGWMFAHPGKKLLFQGLEFGQSAEWRYQDALPWFLLEYDEHRGIQNLVRQLNQLYLTEPALHELDHEPGGFEWVDHDNAEQSAFTFIRRGRNGEIVVVAVNATPIPRRGFRIGVPVSGFFDEVLNTDSGHYGGSNDGNAGGLNTEPIPSHGRHHSLCVNLPPLSTVYFKHRDG